MAHYKKLLEHRDVLLNDLATALQQAEDSIIHENDSSVKIQKVFRGILLRNDLSRKNYYAIEIQRAFRGFVGRGRALQEEGKKLSFYEKAYFNYNAVEIQKNFRGYYSRKYKHNQEKRKRYCERIVRDGNKRREAMENYAEEQRIRMEIEERERKQDEFRNLAQGLNHLVSTAHIRGVYNPNIEFLDKPTLNQLPVEHQIRGVVKDLLRTRGYTKKSDTMVTDLNGTRKIPLKGLKYRLSVQASEPYDTTKNIERAEKLKHDIILKLHDKKAWQCGGKTNIINKDLAPLSTGDPYMDPWANPMLKKGVPENTAQLLESSRLQRPLFITVPEKPFVSRVGGNKSSTMPNDVFDTIAEAEETGGAHQRHRGANTTRFGLSKNMDSRTDGKLPAPPLRASSRLKSTKQSLKVYTHGATFGRIAPNAAITTGENRYIKKPLINSDSSDDEL